MDQSVNKDELVHLLRNGLIDEFNSKRFYDEDTLLDLSEIDLKDIKISGANLSHVDLTGSDLSKCEIEETDFGKSDLNSVNFSYSVIVDSNFSDVILEGSLFNNANIQNSDFSATDFNGINICGVDLTGTDLSLSKNLMQSMYDGETIWPDDDLLPEDFDPQYEVSFAEMEESDGYSEDQYSY